MAKPNKEKSECSGECGSECHSECGGKCGKDCECSGECCADCECSDECDPRDKKFNVDAETQQQIQELQMLEQAFQQIMMQKQAFQFELNETDFALEEVKKAEGDVFKFVGNQVIIKTSKEKMSDELVRKNELLELRLKNLDKQEKEISSRLGKIRQEITKKLSPNAK